MIIGIDPGINGGIAVLDWSGRVLGVSRMPRGPVGLAEVLREYVPHDGARIWVEQVNASPQMGVVSAFTFGRGYGWIEGVAAGLGIPCYVVRPLLWQTALGCRTGGDKNVTKQAAQQMFPGLTITHAIADALLIAEYGRRVQE